MDFSTDFMGNVIHRYNFLLLVIYLIAVDTTAVLNIINSCYWTKVTCKISHIVFLSGHFENTRRLFRMLTRNMITSSKILVHLLLKLKCYSCISYVHILVHNFNKLHTVSIKCMLLKLKINHWLVFIIWI